MSGGELSTSRLHTYLHLALFQGLHSDHSRLVVAWEASLHMGDLVRDYHNRIG